VPNTPDNALIFHNEFHCLLGQYYLFWSTFSQTIDFLIYKFEGQNEDLLNAIAKDRQSTKIPNLQKLIEKYEPDSLVYFNNLIEKILASETRNIITHGYIESDITSVEFSLRPARDVEKNLVKRFTIEEFRKFVGDIIEYGYQLNDLMKVDNSEMDLFVEKYRRCSFYSNG
jgi:uncharacterized radical SAM superfamily Fe-S cluster-containing enzyme